MSERPEISTPTGVADAQSPAKAAPSGGAKIHRVCIGCNNMFEVRMENYEVKHCPVCRKD